MASIASEVGAKSPGDAAPSYQSHQVPAFGTFSLPQRRKCRHLWPGSLDHLPGDPARRQQLGQRGSRCRADPRPQQSG